MTPLERINRLREETEKTRADWLYHSDTSELEVRDSTHMQRWDPDTAGKVLDLLQTVFAYHTNLRGQCLADGTKWPCMEHSAALAVLDQLDGGAANDRHG